MIRNISKLVEVDALLYVHALEIFETKLRNAQQAFEVRLYQETTF